MEETPSRSVSKKFRNISLKKLDNNLKLALDDSFDKSFESQSSPLSLGRIKQISPQSSAESLNARDGSYSELLPRSKTIPPIRKGEVSDSDEDEDNIPISHFPDKSPESSEAMKITALLDIGSLLHIHCISCLCSYTKM
jgi:hypothetical protein